MLTFIFGVWISFDEISRLSNAGKDHCSIVFDGYNSVTVALPCDEVAAEINNYWRNVAKSSGNG